MSALLACILAIFLLFKWVTKNKDFFRDKPIPSVPFRSLRYNTVSLLLRATDIGTFGEQLYNKFADAKIFGMFDTIKPVFVVRDPDLIKSFTAKDFDHFVDRPGFLGNDKNDDPHALFGKSLPMLTGSRWRNMRTTLTPVFTGSKMRQMHQQVLECCDNVVQFLNLEQQEGEVEIVLQDLTSRFAIDVISCCLFGIKLNSLCDRTNKIYTYGTQVSKLVSISILFKMLLIKCFPTWSSRLGIDAVERKHAKYFYEIVTDTIKSRAEQNITANDMINLLTQTQQNQLNLKLTKTLTDSSIAAQLLAFLIAGSSTITFTLVCLIHDLVVHQKVQQKLYEEIIQTQANLDTEKLSYDSLQSMKYMDMVISESMRIHTQFPNLLRQCAKTYTVDDGEGLKFDIEQGTMIWIPAQGLHMDPKHFPDPKRFDPERFNAENRRNIHPATYLPFGAGPRNCIGLRLGLMEIKALLYHLVLNFSIIENSNTPTALPINKGYAFLNALSRDVSVTFQNRSKK
ncbi:probable cytochrome P450 9f2 [Culex pipiens pallens]|uniref:probable cytochrome P450 9f2 n=1 Tax=Culex pipiens pallens TaxID=42434 RepID=UPI001953C99B|nr:probable cytochrome P450 9f2 [Culex pipiens pallens]